MLLAMGSWYLTALILLELKGNADSVSFPLVVRQTEDEEVLDQIGWRGAITMMVAYQVTLGLSYAGIGSAFTYSSSPWMNLNDYNLAFTMVTSALAALSVAGPPDYALSLGIIRGTWRIVAEALLVIPWWFFRGDRLVDPLLGDILRQPSVSRAGAFWFVFAVLVLWLGAKALVRRIHAARNDRPTRG
ncbi:hypothetical protein [Limnochorda pilosa]|uniref:Uncharacterized protein n=1 Tax=Limnochorda pilosa TaxID=1555112 RepID=A0A0K2SH30_LIMPI|nr:hypothetical protein [Limnochorda pilosa]BAS26395.1 hypothetical protein LIP_0538 [Limnochorda pilosa]